MKSFTIIFSSLVIFSVLFGACKKSKNTPSAGDMLVGKWKTSSYGYDVNHNSVIDSSENTPYPDSVSNYTVFNSGGSGELLVTKNGTTDTQTWFSWSLASNNIDVTTIRTKGSSSYISLSDTTTYHIGVLSATDLQLTIVAGSSGLNWQNYKKQ